MNNYESIATCIPLSSPPCPEKTTLIANICQQCFVPNCTFIKFFFSDTNFIKGRLCDANIMECQKCHAKYTLSMNKDICFVTDDLALDPSLCPVDNGATIVEPESENYQCKACQIQFCKVCSPLELGECVQCQAGFYYSKIHKQCLISCINPDSQINPFNTFFCRIPCISLCKF